MKSVFFNQVALDVESKIMNETGIPSIVLMENAGINAVNILSDIADENDISKFFILCGKGNNAGDGFVIARHLCIEGFNVNLILLYDPAILKGDAAINYNLLSSLNFKYTVHNFFSPHDSLPELENSIIIDSIFGIGFKGQPDEHVVNLISSINSVEDKIVIAIDTPSCLELYDTENDLLKCDFTISMGSYKFETLFEKGKEYSGEIIRADIGTGSEIFNSLNENKIFITEESDIRNFVVERNLLSNKYTTGKLLVIAGSLGYTGAAELSTLAAMRMGTGALVVAFPKDAQDIIEAKLTEPVKLAIDYTYKNDLVKLKEKIQWADAILIGPGCGLSEYTETVLKIVLSESQVPVVIDGDALNYFHECDLSNTKAKIILTPHTGEFAKLLKKSSEEIRSDFYNLSMNYANQNNLVLVLKGATTIVTDGNYFYINSSGSENLATFGSGDVLAGIISSILSRNSNALQSATAGCFIHGYCGDELLDKFGSSSLVASDLISIIPEIKLRFNL